MVGRKYDEQGDFATKLYAGEMIGVQRRFRSRVDATLLVLYLLFVIAGWLNIYAASYDLENATTMFDLSTRAGKQLIWIGVSLLMGFILLKIDEGFYETYALLLYLIGIAILMLTCVVAKDIHGSRSWLVLGDVALQPAEFMKFLIALMLAKIISSYNFKLMKPKNFLLVLFIIFLPAVIVVAQNETGTALVYLSFLLALYREGMPGIWLFIIFVAIVYFVVTISYASTSMGLITLGELISAIIMMVFTLGMIGHYLRRDKRKNIFQLFIPPASIFGAAYLVSLFKVSVDWGLVTYVALAVMAVHLFVLFVINRSKSYLYAFIFLIGSFIFLKSVEFIFNNVLQPHQSERINVVLGVEQDTSGAAYNVQQSKIAIGSGGLMGKGYLNGTQTKLKYVPEQDTDFIFCTIGEEHGFVGSLILIVLYVWFIVKIIALAERQKTVFGRVYGYCVASIFIFHLIVNIGMVIGFMPVIGIPLPFFSYGGSSLLGFTIMLFIFLRIDKQNQTFI